MRRQWLTVLVALAMLAGVVTAGEARSNPPTTLYPGGSWEPPAPSYDVFAVKNVQVPMSDGVGITVDVYYPADSATGARVSDEEFPVLLTQTPYSGSIGAANVLSTTGPGAFFVQRGYIYVAADVRGTGRSGGTAGFFGPRDAQDGAELVEWAAYELSGSNGTVGLHGCSYLGLTQLYTAGQLRPATAVKAMIPACVKSDPYRDTYTVSGIPAPQWEGAGLFAGTLLGPTMEAYLVPKYLESQAGGDTAYYGQFWKDRDHTLDAPAIAAARIPTLLWNGWDDAGFGSLELYVALQNAHFGRSLTAPLSRGSRVTGRYQLLLGDWGHGGGLDPGIQLQWYETWLRGIDTGLPVDTKTPIHVQEQESGRWSNLAAYPFTPTSTRFNLAADGSLTAAPVDSATRPLRWAQPDVPGAVLTYETAPLDEGATVAGTGALRVFASSSTNELQLMADLYDVAPDGTAVPISHGGVLGSMRATDPARSWVDGAGSPIRPYLSLTGETPMPAGETLQLDIPLRPTLWWLRPGHKLRLRLVGQEETTRCVQKSTEVTTDAVGCRARAAVQSRLVGATFTISHGDSFLNLPLLGAGWLRETRSGITPTSPDPLPLEW